MRYHEFRPASELEPFVQCHAEFRVDAGHDRPFTHLLMSDGCAHLTHFRDPRVAEHSLTLSGPRQHGIEIEMRSGQFCWDVKFRPGGLEPLLGASLVDLSGYPTLASALLPAL